MIAWMRIPYPRAPAARQQGPLSGKKGDENPMKPRRILSCMMALLLAATMPLTAFAGTYDVAEGSVTVNA